MKLVANLDCMNNLKELAELVEAVLVPKSLITRENVEQVASFGLLSILDFSEMVHPFELEELKEKVLEFKDMDCLFYITDLGLAQILIDEGLVNRTIYDPRTLITNHLDAQILQEYGFNALGISNEITIEDTQAIITQGNIKAFLQVFGYRLMFHSRRKLISLYEEKLSTTFLKDNLVLKEEKREDFFPIEENDRGTFIYRGYAIALFKELKRLDIAYAYISNYRIEETAYFSILKLYKNYLLGNLTEEDLLKQIQVPISSGFAYQDSVYHKEEAF